MTGSPSLSHFTSVLCASVIPLEYSLTRFLMPSVENTEYTTIPQELSLMGLSGSPKSAGGVQFPVRIYPPFLGEIKFCFGVFWRPFVYAEGFTSVILNLMVLSLL